jgi:hypothetical protein
MEKLDFGIVQLYVQTSLFLLLSYVVNFSVAVREK